MTGALATSRTPARSAPPFPRYRNRQASLAHPASPSGPGQLLPFPRPFPFLAPVAEAADVTVLLETHDAFCKGKDVAAVLDQVPSSHVQAVWDVHHPWRMGETVAETWDFIGDRVAHVHLKDARHRPDGSFVLTLMGQGDVPNREIVELLEAQGYAGCYSAEWEKKWHPDIEEPEIALPQHAEVILAWLQ